jgi:hypothetical protein
VERDLNLVTIFTAQQTFPGISLVAAEPDRAPGSRLIEADVEEKAGSLVALPGFGELDALLKD